MVGRPAAFGKAALSLVYRFTRCLPPRVPGVAGPVGPVLVVGAIFGSLLHRAYQYGERLK